MKLDAAEARKLECLTKTPIPILNNWSELDTIRRENLVLEEKAKL